MIKTLKKKELTVLFDTEENFLLDYYKHLQENPDSLLSKILGVYEVSVQDQEPLVFFITENMVGNDYPAITRCYDLKGSLYKR